VAINGGWEGRRVRTGEKVKEKGPPVRLPSKAVG